MGRKAGLTDEKLRAVVTADAARTDELSIFNETERLVIELADAMTATPPDISDELYARLRDSPASPARTEEALMQLAAQIAFENYRARWNRVFDVGSDHIYNG